MRAALRLREEHVDAFDAEAFRADLGAIYAYGLERWGLEQAERSRDALFIAFDDLATGRRLHRPHPASAMDLARRLEP